MNIASKLSESGLSVTQTYGYSFAGFTLDCDHAELIRGGAVVPLRPKAFDVLCYLAERAGHQVSKEKIMADVWPDVVVTEGSLIQCVVDIRRALGEDSRDIVRTVRGRGFILDVPVTVVEDSPERDTVRAQSSGVNPSARRTIAVITLLALSLVWSWSNGIPVPQAPKQRLDSQPAIAYSELHAGTGSNGESDVASSQDQSAANLASNNPRAAEHRQKGHFFYNRREAQDIERSIDQFRLALDYDPEMIDAWRGLASAFLLQYSQGKMPVEEALFHASRALEHALAIDPNDPEVQLLMSHLSYIRDQQNVADRHLRRAAELGGNSALVLGVVAGIQMNFGEYDRAISLQRRSVSLAPLSFVAKANLANFYYIAGRYDEALQTMAAAEDLSDRTEEYFQYETLIMQLARGDRTAARRSLALIPAGEDRDAALAIMAGAGASAAVERLRRSDGYRPAMRLAEIYARGEDPDQAFLWLDTASKRILEAGYTPYKLRQELSELRQSPLLNSLQGDSRWQRWWHGIESGYMPRSKLEATLALKVKSG